MIVIAHKPGRLANRLLVFAHLAAFALRNGQRVCNPSFDEYADLFPETRTAIIPSFPPASVRLRPPAFVRRVVYELSYLAARTLTRLPVSVPGVCCIQLKWDAELDLSSPAAARLLGRRGVVFVQGWGFRDRCGFITHARAIRAFFRPLDCHARQAREVVAQAREGNDVLVGVHIRRGDYRTAFGGRYLFGGATYRAAMARVCELFRPRRVGFVICSDEPIAGREMVGREHEMGPGHPLADLLTLSGCDYIIGPPSTFSIWASYYGDVPLWLIENGEEAPRFMLPQELWSEQCAGP